MASAAHGAQLLPVRADAVFDWLDRFVVERDRELATCRLFNTRLRDAFASLEKTSVMSSSTAAVQTETHRLAIGQNLFELVCPAGFYLAGGRTIGAEGHAGRVSIQK